MSIESDSTLRGQLLSRRVCRRGKRAQLGMPSVGVFVWRSSKDAVDLSWVREAASNRRQAFRAALRSFEGSHCSTWPTSSSPSVSRVAICLMWDDDGRGVWQQEVLLRRRGLEQRCRALERNRRAWTAALAAPHTTPGSAAQRTSSRDACKRFWCGVQRPPYCATKGRLCRRLAVFTAEST